MDEDLYYDNDDREKLNSMPETKREAIIFERREQRKEKETRKKLLKLSRDMPDHTKTAKKDDNEPELFINSSTTIGKEKKRFTSN